MRLLLWEEADERIWRTVDQLRATPGLDVVLLTHPAVDEASVAQRARARGTRLDASRIIEQWQRERSGDPAPATPSEVAAAALSLRCVDVAVGGLATTSAEVLRAGLRYVGLSSDVRTVSIGGFVEPVAGPSAGRLFLMTDTGAVPDPSVQQYVDIAVNAVKSWRAVSREPPRLAFLSASTRGSSARLPNLDRIRRAIDALQQRYPSLDIDGEMQADAALAPGVARSKGLGGSVAGKANILVFPNLDSCNIGYKLVEHLGGALTAPVTQGFARSFHDVSRGASIEDFVATCFIAAMIALSADEQERTAA